MSGHLACNLNTCPLDRCCIRQTISECTYLPLRHSSPTTSRPVKLKQSTSIIFNLFRLASSNTANKLKPMYLRIYASILALFFVTLFSLSNKNGRAASQNRGNTGAPGDEMSLGFPKTCKNCHGQGPITATLEISVLDNNGQAISQYQPGTQYTARVKINATGQDLKGYGFQMIALKDAGNTDLDGFTDTNPNNYKIASISNGRTYAEHDNISTTNTFDVAWKAPLAGAGSVTFYAAGNGVNSNGGTGGDGSAVSSLRLTEANTVPTTELSNNTLKLFPNPIQENATLDLSAFQTKDIKVTAFDPSGKIIWQTTTIQSDQILIPSSEWASGTYFIRVEGPGIQLSTKALKI